MLKKITVISTMYVMISFSSLYAEKIKCDLLSPMQKKIYQAYCKSIEKQAAKKSGTVDSKKNKSLTKTKLFLKKFTGKLNTDSILVDKIKGKK